MFSVAAIWSSPRPAFRRPARFAKPFIKWAKAQAERHSLRAMTGALQHAQIGDPRADSLTILVGHHAR